MSRLHLRLVKLEQQAAQVQITAPTREDRDAALASVRAVVEPFEAAHPLTEAERTIEGVPLLRPPLEEWSVAERLSRASGLSMNELTAHINAQAEAAMATRRQKKATLVKPWRWR